MNMTVNAILLGVEDVISSKGNKYQMVLFGQGTNTLSCVLKLEHSIDFPLYKPCVFSLVYDTRWKQFRCVGVDVCK